MEGAVDDVDADAATENVTDGDAAVERTADAVESADEAVSALVAAASSLEASREAVAERGSAEVELIAGVHEEVAGILDRYEERATDWDDLEGYAEFRTSLGRTLEDLPEDLPEEIRQRLETVDDLLVTGGVAEVLSAADFERAREELAPARECVDRRDEWRSARERYRNARSAAARRRSALADRIEGLERLQSLGEADLDAPVERLREPIEAYDEGVADAFVALRREASASELLDLVDDAARRPLVPCERPPPRLRGHLDDHQVGAEPVPTLVEYAGYSRSKLAHYVADPDAFRSAVAPNQTYLERLDAAPLQVEWPPPPADRLRFRCAELVPLVGQFAPAAVTARLRTVRDLTLDEEYERLRRSAVARAELDEAERRRVQSGAVASALSAARDARERLDDVLATHPPLAERSPP